MVIAMTIVGVMQMPADKIVHMVAVRHAFVPTGRTVRMLVVVGFAIVIGRARVWIGLPNGHRMLINMSAMNVVHVPIVKIVGMAVVHHGLVAALSVVCVTVGGVLFTYRIHEIDTSMPEIAKGHVKAYR